MKEQNMRHFLTSILGALMILTIAASVALADTIHSITVSFSDTTVTASGDISGLGSKKPAFAVLEVNGFALYTCANKGGNEAPGQNPVPLIATSPAQDLGNTVNNGRGTVDVSVTLTAPASVSASTAGCPNNNWKATLKSVTVASATLTITQGNQTIFQQTYDNPNN
jgi:hypothetical protein